ncbi:MAG: hypothetical protein FE037_05405 [Thermoplasmata archaeon]|nr:MAG: hypothetical protein FE042_03150 [Thermoplasmata archaeon]KAA0009590.1 MAG: hypothetical protein FE037_05405 [Thermoplasmata archaeon]
MGLIERLEKNIEKLEKRIEKNKQKIEELERKYREKKLTKADFIKKKRKYEDLIHGLNARIRILRGGIAREKREMEEKKKKEEK